MTHSHLKPPLTFSGNLQQHASSIAEVPVNPTNDPAVNW